MNACTQLIAVLIAFLATFSPLLVLADEQAGTWPFQPGEDAFTDDALLDLRFLNEKEAGQSGFVRVSDDGNGFVRGDGDDIRFWAVGAFYGGDTTDAQLVEHARFLAKIGVNGVRVGGAQSGLIPQEPGCKITDINEKERTKLWRIVAAMKKEGIYTRFSPFWDHGNVKYIGEDWGIEGYKSGDSLNGLQFFHPVLQSAWKSWMRKLLTEKNPYTGIALKDDPALSILQIASEDTLFFFWMSRVKGGPRRLLETLFADFTKKKYDTLDKGLEAWGRASVEGDSIQEGRLGLYPLWRLQQSPVTGNPQRIRDQVEFYAQTEYNYYKEMKRYLREDLGVKQIITASNFASADATQLGDLQRWCWTAGDAIEINRFHGSNLSGPNAGWRIEAGAKYTPGSALRGALAAIPAAVKQVSGMPFVISSTTWVPPQDYYAEGPILNAAYGAMNGIDGLYWLGCRHPRYGFTHMGWLEVKGSHPMVRWTISHPGMLSQFPAAALIFRQGLVDPADVVVHDVRTMDELLDRRPPLVIESDGYDAATHADEALPAKRELMSSADPKALLVGRVETAYGTDTGSRVADIASHIRNDGKEIETTHGQLVLNREQGLLQINAPKAQGVVGFLRDAGGAFALADLTIHSASAYASIIAVPLDNVPLKVSKKILVQVGTQTFPSGWQTKPVSWQRKGKTFEGVEIVSTGGEPWLCTNVDASVSLHNQEITRATLLDVNGYEVRDVALTRTDNVVKVTLPKNTMYLVLRAADETAPRVE